MKQVEHKGNVKVRSRVSRLNYGMTCNPTFIEGKHDEGDRYWSNKEQKYTARHQMNWYLRKNDNVLEHNPASFSYYRLMKSPHDLGHSMTFEIMQSEQDNADPRGDIPFVTELCRLECHHVISFEDLDTWTNSLGVQYRKLHFDVRMACNGAALEWSCSIEGQEETKHEVVASFYDSGRQQNRSATSPPSPYSSDTISRVSPRLPLREI